MKRLAPLVPVFLAAIGAVSCSSTPEATEPDPNNPCPPGQYCPPPPPVTPAPTTTATTTQPATPSGQATPIAPLAAAAATPVLTAMAAQEAPGMQAEGGPFAGQFQEGQVLEQDINISPGKCYTVIAVAVGMIQELDLQLAVQPTPQVPPMVLAQDNSTGSAATLGGKASGCWKNPTPLGGPGKIIMRATKGTGIAVAQVFSK